MPEATLVSNQPKNRLYPIDVKEWYAQFYDSFTIFWLSLIKKCDLFEDIADWWDILVKPSIKDFCGLYSSRRAKRMKDTTRFWFSYLNVCLKKRIGTRFQELKLFFINYYLSEPLDTEWGADFKIMLLIPIEYN